MNGRYLPRDAGALDGFAEAHAAVDQLASELANEHTHPAAALTAYYDHVRWQYRASLADA